MNRSYAILDVFTNTPLAGNPLAVVTDTEGLDTAKMQAIAREFNLSETVFVFPSDLPAHTAKLRIFSPYRELPFAGHPTIGTAIFLATERFGEIKSEQNAMIVLEEGIGTVRCGVVLRENATGFAEFDIPQLPKPLGPPADKADIATALDLSPHEIGFENHRPSNYSVGVPFTFVPVADLSVLAKAHPRPSLWTRGFGSGEHNRAFVYCRETKNCDSGFHGRMFAIGHGVSEDPATGAAAAAFSAVVHYFDDLTDGTHLRRIEQGFEMGRPSLIDLEIDIENGELHAARIGGQAIIVARGELFV